MSQPRRARLAEACVSQPTDPEDRWEQTDLVRRVGNSLEVALQAIRTIVGPMADGTPPASGDARLRGEKLVAETAMLLMCVEPIAGCHVAVRERARALAETLIPYARHDDLLAAICLDPGCAADHSVAHCILSRLGYLNPVVDDLLAASLAMGPGFGPERLPHQRLEQAWLNRLWPLVTRPIACELDVVAESMLGRRLDALGAGRLDIYAFTHAVMYASDLGLRQPALPRLAADIVADAEAGLAYSLDNNDYDLTAELLFTWPMLGLAWSAPATFAFQILADVEDQLGFLPGSTFDQARYKALAGKERHKFALITSYHTAYVMGFLCAAALRPGRAPPTAVAPVARSARAGVGFWCLFAGDRSNPCWREPFKALSSRQQDAIAPLLLAMLLRRARANGDLALVRTVLKAALINDVLDGPAPEQAAALLRRTLMLGLRPAPTGHATANSSPGNRSACVDIG
jgi:hypothetical protein